jgi:phosphoesterase RecJ-like protein
MNLTQNEKEIITKIHQSNNIAITTHSNPDGDAIGSSLALEKCLSKLNKKVDILMPNKLPKKFETIVKDSAVYNYKYYNKQYDLVFLLDCSDKDRTIKNLENLSDCIITIDHHHNATSFGDIYINKPVASTGIILYNIINHLMDNELSSDIATSLYMTIKTDTGNFKNNNTDAQAHKVSSELLLQGANIKLLNEIFNTKPLSLYRLMAEAFDNILVNSNYGIIYVILKVKYIERSNSTYKDASRLINYIKDIKGCEVAYVFLEDNNSVKVSARSKNINISKVMEEFDGGGHKTAAGAKIYSNNTYHVVNSVMKKTKKYIDSIR